MAGFDMKDYVQVNERIEAFYRSHPDGSIQTEIHTLTDKLVIVKAAAYRSPSDALPCIAHSQLGIPGKTSFTKDSEVENAETSAVGRALAMMGFEVKRGMASREEVRSKASSVPEKHTNSEETTPEPVLTGWQHALKTLLDEHGMKAADLTEALGAKPNVANLKKYIDDQKVHYHLALEALVLSAKVQKETADG